MTKIYYDRDADLAELNQKSIAVVGYGNQGRSWALNLRDSGLEVRVCTRADESREFAMQDGFEVSEVRAASDADVVCVLVPDDVIPRLPLERNEGQLTIVASGYCLAFDRFKPPGDPGLVAPRMLGHGIPLEAVLTELFLSGEVERTYRLLREEGFSKQLEHHSPTSQYGQLVRRGSFDSLEFVPLMQEIVEEIRSGRFADAWDAEQRSDHQHLEQLKEAHAGPAIRAMEEDLRRRLGPEVGD